MLELIKKYVKNKEIISVYTNLDCLDRFEVGYILSNDEERFAMLSTH